MHHYAHADARTTVIGEIVAAMASVHAPQLIARPADNPPELLDASIAAMRELGRVLDATKPDALIVIGIDHVETFNLDAIPTFALLTSRTAEAEFAKRSYSIPVHQPLALGLLDGLVDRGFDMTFSQRALLGHAYAVPFEFILADRPIPVVPLFVNVYLPPQPKPRRCAALGAAIAEVVAQRPERVAILASGGMSHFPGTAQYGSPNFAFDRWAMDCIEAGDLDALLDLTLDELDEVGNGELLGWFVLFGAIGNRAGSVLSYQPLWHHGHGVVQFIPPVGARAGDAPRRADATRTT
jgi:aromatic ring-opening dioxygenase catalytic subunit (LigB family)